MGLLGLPGPRVMALKGGIVCNEMSDSLAFELSHIIFRYL